MDDNFQKSDDCAIMIVVINITYNMVRRPAKKGIKVNKGLVGAIGAAAVGVVAGAAAIFLSKKENREMVKKTVDSTVKKGKVELAKAGKKIAATKKKLMKKK